MQHPDRTESVWLVRVEKNNRGFWFGSFHEKAALAYLSEDPAKEVSALLSGNKETTPTIVRFDKAVVKSWSRMQLEDDEFGGMNTVRIACERVAEEMGWGKVGVAWHRDVWPFCIRVRFDPELALRVNKERGEFLEKVEERVSKEYMRELAFEFCLAV